jgi:hypothetical protein
MLIDIEKVSDFIFRIYKVQFVTGKELNYLPVLYNKMLAEN